MLHRITLAVQEDDIKSGLIKQSVVLPSRGTSTAWRYRQRNSMKFSFMGNAKSCTWGRTTQSVEAGEQLGRESPEGPGGHQPRWP